IRRGKHQPRKFDFKPLDHVELAEKLELIDFEGGAKVAGHGFYFLKNEAVLLELALQRYALDLLIAEGFTPTITPDMARNAILQYFCDLEGRIFDGLGIPYRVVDTATGDLGGPAYRKFDLEAWMPGRGEAGEYGEVTSTSNCTDYQARRLGIRYRKAGEKGTSFVHTLNGTAIAISRALIAILENHQQADGSVEVPEVLRPWVGKERLEPRK